MSSPKIVLYPPSSDDGIEFSFPIGNAYTRHTISAIPTSPITKISLQRKSYSYQGLVKPSVPVTLSMKDYVSFELTQKISEKIWSNIFSFLGPQAAVRQVCKKWRTINQKLSSERVLGIVQHASLKVLWPVYSDVSMPSLGIYLTSPQILKIEKAAFEVSSMALSSLPQEEQFHIRGMSVSQLSNNINTLFNVMKKSADHEASLIWDELSPKDRAEIGAQTLQEVLKDTGLLCKLFQFCDAKSLTIALRSFIPQSLELNSTLSQADILVSLIHSKKIHVKGLQLITTSVPFKRLLRFPSALCSLSSLRQLQLQGHLFFSLPNDIGNMAKLEKLYLDGNNISYIPPAIGDLESLTALTIRNNPLSSLPETLGSLQRVEVLNLSNNHLTEVPHSIGLLKNLEILELNGNKITELPPEIGNLENLKCLDISNNSLSQLPPELLQLKKLTVLSIFGNWDLESHAPSQRILRDLIKTNPGISIIARK